jgi:hypothetical protein
MTRAPLFYAMSHSHVPGGEAVPRLAHERMPSE